MEPEEALKNPTTRPKMKASKTTWAIHLFPEDLKGWTWIMEKRTVGTRTASRIVAPLPSR